MADVDILKQEARRRHRACKETDMRSNAIRAAALLVAALLAPLEATAQATAVRDTHELLNPTLWIQTSAEYRVICRTTYAMAARALDAALLDPAWSAAVEQPGTPGLLPPAVIMDLDETVLDNSPFAARLVTDRIPFDPKVWSDWVARAEAGALPGALEFIRYAESKGVTIFYVTNRSADQEAATRANLARLGITLPADADTVLMSRERPEWRSDKGPRRAHVAATHRILLLVGDDLGDFVSGAQEAPEKRIAAAERHGERWGVQWFMIPNPMNGSWEMSLYSGFPPDPEVLRGKVSRLRSFP